MRPVHNFPWDCVALAGGSWEALWSIPALVGAGGDSTQHCTLVPVPGTACPAGQSAWGSFPTAPPGKKASGKTFTAKMVPWLSCMFRAVLLLHLMVVITSFTLTPSSPVMAHLAGLQRNSPFWFILGCGMIQPRSLLSAQISLAAFEPVVGYSAVKGWCVL